MSIALLLIPLALLLLAAAIAAFFWAVDNDQFEDLDEAAALEMPRARRTRLIRAPERVALAASAP